MAIAVQDRTGNTDGVAAEGAATLRARHSGWGMRNVPACRYAVHKEMLKAPLLDTTVPEDKLADWIHARTMRVHGFLDEQARCCCLAGPCTTTAPYTPFQYGMRWLLTREQLNLL